MGYEISRIHAVTTLDLFRFYPTCCVCGHAKIRSKGGPNPTRIALQQSHSHVRELFTTVGPWWGRITPRFMADGTIMLVAVGSCPGTHLCCPGPHHLCVRVSFALLPLEISFKSMLIVGTYSGTSASVRSSQSG